MRYFIVNLRNAFKLGWWAFRNNQTLTASNFKMLSDLLAIILKTGAEGKHHMTRVALVHPPSDTVNEIVSIWVGSGIGSDPLDRIKELLEENKRLKIELGLTV